MGPEVPRQLFVDDDDSGCVRGVTVREEAAGLERYLESLEIARRHIELSGRNDGFGRLGALPFGDDGTAAAVSRERQVAAESGLLYVRQRAHTGQRPARIRPQRRIVGVARGKQADATGEDV